MNRRYADFAGYVWIAGLVLVVVLAVIALVRMGAGG